MRIKFLQLLIDKFIMFYLNDFKAKAYEIKRTISQMLAVIGLH